MKKHISLSVVFLLLMLLSVSGQIKVQDISTSDPKYPYKKGSLLFSKENFKMNYVKNTEIRKDTLLMKNNSGRPVTLAIKKAPEYLTGILSSDTLLPGQEGQLVVAFDASKKNDYGYSYESIILLTNDTVESEKFFFVMVYIEEDFSKLTPEQWENAPGIHFTNEVFDFGKVKAGEKVKFAYVFTNKGKSDLIIRRTKASCGCTATEPEKLLLKPGESSQINVVFDSTGLKGEQHKTVYVYCNDPRYSTVALQLNGEVY